MVMAVPEPGDSAVDLARQRRHALGRATARLELMAAAPASAPGWASRVEDGLRQLRVALSAHVAEVERPDGILDEICDAAPHLDRAVRAVREEHAVLCEALDHALDVASAGNVGDIRDVVLGLVASVARHRQLGADLVYDAFAFDIGGTG